MCAEIVAPFLTVAVEDSATRVRFVITGVASALHSASGLALGVAVTGLPQLLITANLN